MPKYFFLALSLLASLTIHATTLPGQTSSQDLVGGNRAYFASGIFGRHGLFHGDSQGTVIQIDTRHPYVISDLTGPRSTEIEFKDNSDVAFLTKATRTTPEFAFAMMLPDIVVMTPDGTHSHIHLMLNEDLPVKKLKFLSQVFVKDQKHFLYIAAAANDGSQARVVLFNENLDQVSPRSMPISEAWNPEYFIEKLVSEIHVSGYRHFSRDALYTNETLSRLHRNGAKPTLPVLERWEDILEGRQPVIQEMKTQADPLKSVSSPAQEAWLAAMKGPQLRPTLTDVEVKGVDGNMVSALSLIADFTENLTDLYAKQPIKGFVPDPDQQRRITEVLAGHENANVAYVGLPGVGKTQEIMLLASDAANGRGPKYLREYTFISVSAQGIESNGKFIGTIPGRIEAMLALARKNKIIWVVDEAHLLKGRGQHSGQSYDITQTLKADMATGQFRMIGMSTAREFTQAFSSDRPFMERFTMIEKPEPSGEQLRRILRGWAEKYGYAQPSDEFIEEAIRIANDFDAVGAQPRKTTRLLDAVYARLRLNGSTAAPDLDLLHAVARERLRFDPALYDHSQAAQRLQALEIGLNKTIIGQDAAKNILRSSALMYLSGLHNRQQPWLKALLTGPEGQGKTSLAIAFAKSLGLPYEVIEMSQWSVGALPARGPLARAAAAVATNPFTVLIFDEIEKCPPPVQEELLRALNEGRTVVQRETTPGTISSDLFDFRHTAVFFTANAGAIELGKNKPGFVTSQQNDESDIRNLIRQGNISRYLLDRVDDVIAMKPLNREQFILAVDKNIEEVLSDLQSRGISVQITDRNEFLQDLKDHWVPGLSNRQIAKLLRPIRTLAAREKVFGSSADGRLIKIRLMDCEDRLL